MTTHIEEQLKATEKLLAYPRLSPLLRPYLQRQASLYRRDLNIQSNQPMNAWHFDLTANLSGLDMPSMSQDHADNLHDAMAEAIRSYLVTTWNMDGETVRIQSHVRNQRIKP